jgi:hypothetical protein
LYPDGRVNTVKFRSQFYASGAGIRRSSDRDDVFDTKFAGARDNLNAVDIEFCLIQMRVGIKEMHRASRFDRELTPKLSD